MIYGHGDDLYRYGGRVRTNFSSNICQNADLGALKRHLAARLDVIGNYPEPAPLSLEKALAGEQGVDKSAVRHSVKSGKAAMRKYLKKFL